MAMFKRCCVTHQPAIMVLYGGRRRRERWVGAGSDTIVTGVVGSRQRHTVDHLSAKNLRNGHGASCVINPIEAKAQFPALTPGEGLPNRYSAL